jgi:hypothetical protein
MPPVHKGRPQQLLRRGSSCNDGSIPRDRAGLPYSRPRCLSLHIRPLGICSRFADRGLSVFVIESLPVRSNFFGAPGPREITRQSPLCPDSDQIRQRSEMTLCANRRHGQRRPEKRTSCKLRRLLFRGSIADVRRSGTIGAPVDVSVAYPAFERLQLVFEPVQGMRCAAGKAHVVATADRRVIDPEMTWERVARVRVHATSYKS